ncbi:MAG TPA: dipeptidase [Sphingobacteriaceae bacterium]|nr:dipeptidase [Sphingobacteriaceae bacterium]
MAEDITAYVAAADDDIVAQLKDFLRIPSISALPEHRGDIQRAAQWVAGALRAAGMPRVDIMDTGGAPLVFAHWHVSDQLPTVIIYGHYDVQPVDPLDLWSTPPFEPSVRGGRLYARGASDDKGNIFMPIKAVEAYKELHGQPPLNIKFLIEGEEEVGSPHLAAFMEKHRDLLAAHLAICADGSMWDHQTPSLVTGSRGLAGLQIDVTGPAGDLHSGNHGGGVQNPLHALAAILAGLRSPEGKILVPGFYDDVRDLTPEEKAAIDAVPFDEEAYKAQLGVAELFGEPGYSTLERQWVRPTLEVNGMWGGFQGEGIKTVLPSTAHAKITCRLVPDQDPDKVLDLVEAHIMANVPPGVQVSVRRFPGSARPYVMPVKHIALTVAADILSSIYGRRPLVTRMGGTLPVAEMFRRLLGVNMVFYSFGGPDDQIHAPDESLPLAAIRRGIVAHYEYLGALARVDARQLQVSP